MKIQISKKLLLISIFTVCVNAQDFDPAFLDSLPEDIAQDLLDNSKKIDAREEIQYRRPSTFIEKPEPTSNRFGAKVFSMMQTTLMPINEPNFDGSYILDFGDKLELQLIGQQSSTNTIIIRRDGSVNIKDIGKVYLAGLSLDEAADLIKSMIDNSFIGVSAYITLINVRDIQVTITGNAFNPGIYTLSGNSNIFHALSISGGPSDNGSFRVIDLIRDNKKIETVDLYDTFINGKSSFETRLRSGDLIFINPVQNIVTVSGAVNRAGEYELLKEERLGSALLFSNKINKFADLNNIKLERILDGRIKAIEIINTSQFEDIVSNDGDRIFIREHPFRSVLIEGAVLNPGSYLMNEGDSIEDAINKAGGYLSNAYPFGGVYENETTQKINSDAKELLYNTFLNNLMANSYQISESEGSNDSIISLIATLKETKPSGRIIADFTNLDDQTKKVFLQNNDTIFIPEFLNQVYVYGELSSEGTAEFIEGEDVSYYLNKKGGLNEFADKKSIYIIQPNGETVKYAKNRNIFMSDLEKETKIYSGSIIFVPRKYDNEYSNRLRGQAYASILSSLGVSLASLSVLKD
jgi:protein involved in polysaccharide export with SLBB domain